MTKRSAFDSSPTPRARADVASVELDGEVVILDEREDALHLLNPTATTVWRCLDGSGTVGELIADLSEVFGSDPQTVRNDVGALLSDLAARRLLEDGTQSSGAEAAAVTSVDKRPHWSAEPPGS
jgi:hypothetical protein